MLLPSSLISKVINTGLSQGADFCEIYVEQTSAYSIELKDSKTSCLSGQDRGVGIRLFFANEELYTYSNQWDEASLIQAVKKLALLKKRDFQQSKLLKGEEAFQEPFFHKFPQNYKDYTLQSKKSFLQKLDKDLRATDSRISQCMLSFSGKTRRVQIANSEGLHAFEERPYHRFHVSSVAEELGQKEWATESTGFSGAKDFFNMEELQALCKNSSHLALQNLTADKAPAGLLPVILNHGFGGVIFHEACGHGLETTSVADNKSVFSNKFKKKIAKDCVTAYDDGTLKGEYGSLMIDDEGQAVQKTKLIDKGTLNSYMVDKMGSQKTNYKITGSARRESYKYPPTSRMRNTYIAAGDSDLEDMIKSVDYGLFAEKLGGGSVTPGTGRYNFAVMSARLIKNGKLGKPVKGASLIGDGLSTLSKIEKVGKDLKLSPGMCGSVSGWVPVTVGQPPILVSELTVGGTSSKASSGMIK